MNPRAYRIDQLLQLAACTQCQLCVDACPAVRVGKQGELSALYRIKGLERLLRSRKGLLSRLLGFKDRVDSQLRSFSPTVFRCTLCANCQEVCPVGLQLRDLWVSVRQDLVHSGVYPKKIEVIRENLEESRNVFGEDNEDRAEWVEDLDDPPEHGYIKEKAEVAYFTGCVASYFPLAQKIPLALAEIFQKAHIDFTLLGEDEWCCGFPMLGAGLGEMFDEFREHNIQAISERGIKEVVFACPSCFQMWREYYKINNVRIMHATQYLLKLILQGHLVLKGVDMVVTYHDPCDLGRGARIFEEPREIIKAIPGVKLVELPNSGQSCQCCGGGGNLEMTDRDLSAGIAKKKIEEVLSTGAQAVITSCQQCVRTMTTFVRRNKISVEVMDITQLLAKALKD